jgi:hypothetical protein
MLVSAYDLHYRNIEAPFDFASVVFLDSGGYEASKDTDLSDLSDRKYIPGTWSQDLHEQTLAGWNSRVPTVIVS